MEINTYLTFNGNCEEAFKFYEQLLGGKIVAIFTHEGTPAASQVPPEWLKKIMHARLIVGNAVLMGSDAPPERFKGAHGFSINIGVKSVSEAERVFSALAENGTVHMPLGETFWAERFGMLTDRFGIPWMVNFERAGATAA